MITYSRHEMERQLVADQTLWRRVPAAGAAVLWPLEVVILGWSVGWWLGMATVVALGAASILVPPRLGVSIYLIDLLDRALRLPLQLGWLALAWHLCLREPLFPLLGQPLVGAIAVTVSLWVLTRLLAFLTKVATQQALLLVNRGR